MWALASGSRDTSGFHSSLSCVAVVSYSTSGASLSVPGRVPQKQSLRYDSRASGLLRTSF